MKLLAFHPAALAEFEAEILHCARERIGAAAHVRADVSETLMLVREFPGIGRADSDGARRIVTRRYRFILHYEILDEQIVVWAVAHPSREPGYWRARRK